MYTQAARLTIFKALLCAISAVFLLASGLASDSVALDKRLVKGAMLYVITVDLNDPDVRLDIALPARGITHSESFLKMIGRHAPVAAVTGTYFDTRTLIPVGTIVVEGKPAVVNCVGTAVCFVKTGPYTVKFVSRRVRDRCDWTGVECGLQTGPRLLSMGRFVFNPRQEGFRQPSLFGRRTRMALGITNFNKLLLVAVRTPVTFGKLASIMRTLGATDAVALDGGSSSAMYYRGKLVCRPGRALTNIIVVHHAPAIAEPKNVASVRPAWPDRIALAILAEPASEPIAFQRSKEAPVSSYSTNDQYAAIPAPLDLRPAKGGHLYPHSYSRSKPIMS